MPDVQWQLTRRAANTFVLRNVGTDTAKEVSVDPESATGINRNLPEGVTLRPQESVEFIMIAAWGAPVPNEIQVSSTGFEDPQIVPVPT
jgi:hypothetical protein